MKPSGRSGCCRSPSSRWRVWWPEVSAACPRGGGHGHRRASRTTARLLLPPLSLTPRGERRRRPGPRSRRTPRAARRDGERTVLLELRQRRQELDGREATLAARKLVLVATELKLSARVAELQALQKKLEGLEQAREQREDTSWRGLVKVYESMKPRDAAVIFNDLDMPVLLQVVDRMKEAKAAPVLAAMQADKARDVTTKLADMRTGRDGPGTAAPAAERQTKAPGRKDKRPCRSTNP